jgi:hypothetical protein
MVAVIKHACKSYHTKLVFRRCLVVISTTTPAILTLGFHCFIEYLLANGGKILLTIPQTDPFSINHSESWKLTPWRRKKGPSWEAASRSARQQCHQHFMQAEDSLSCSRQPSTGPYSEPDVSSPYHPIVYKLQNSSINIKSLQTKSHCWT